MKDIVRSSHRLFLLLAAAVAITGCATSRDVVAPKLTATAVTSANPAQGIPVRIQKIEDMRRFEASPSEPSTPSLMDGAINDQSIRTRAIARKRNGYGMAMGDILLPEGQSANQLVEDAMTRAFREAGYRVVSESDPDYAQATPVSARIDKLWAWLSPGFWALTLESNYEIGIDTRLPSLQQESKFSGQVKDSMQIATADDWATIVGKALEDFSARLKQKLASK